MKVLIYGGSFDPAHKGHHAILKAAAAQIRPDKIHIFTAYNSPYKEASARPFEIRRETAKSALQSISRKIIFDDFEKQQSRVVYAWETVKHIKKLYPGAKIYLLVGADCLNDIKKWKNTPYLKQNCTLLAGLRKGVLAKKTDFPFTLLKGEFPEVSSTQIRLEILINGKIPRGLPPKTAALIKKDMLYGLNLHKWLSQNLKAKRYLHAKLVAKIAVKLAKIYKIDEEKAAYAAILHDCAKGMDNKELIKYCLKNNLRTEDFEKICKYSPALLHADVSAHIAEHKFGVKDADILNAIKNHTLGREDMSLLEKILFIADMASEDREAKEAKKILAIALKSLEAAMAAAMTVKITFTIKTQKWLAPRGLRLWNKTISSLN